MKQFETDLSPKISQKHHCELCDYYSYKITDYKKHLQTIKHKNRQNETFVTDLSPKVAKNLQCICGISFNNRTTLWRHKKICKDTDDNELKIDSIASLSDKELITKVILQIPELVKSIIEISKDKGINHSHNHTNSHNKTFNLQFFLNETCKDAMNISDFVSSIKPKLIDLENTGRLGYAEGISNIILKNLNNLEQHFRPLHCSDSKREVIYIKDNDEWTKETDNKPILTKAIKVIANENIKNITAWRKEHPDCTDSDSKKNDLYLKIVSNSMCGATKDETDKNINKIITNIAKEVIIDKE
jgi:hypothetical protein